MKLQPPDRQRANAPSASRSGPRHGGDFFRIRARMVDSRAGADHRAQCRLARARGRRRRALREAREPAARMARDAPFREHAAARTAGEPRLSDFAQSQFVHLQNFVQRHRPASSRCRRCRRGPARSRRSATSRSRSSSFASTGNSCASCTARSARAPLHGAHDRFSRQHRHRVEPATAERVAPPGRRAVARGVRADAKDDRAHRSEMVCGRSIDVGLSWLLVGMYVRRVRVDASAGTPLLLGGLLMVY